MTPLPTASPTTRQGVYDAIDSERAYQDKRWSRQSDGGHNPHSVTEWLTYIRIYAEKGLEIAATGSDPLASQEALEFARKCAALGVVCMEQHGAPRRAGF